MARAYSPEHLREIQWKKFTDLLEFAYDRIPLYRDRFRRAGITPESIKSREDLVRIPILTKDEIRQNFPDQMLDNSRRYDPGRMGQTSGSTAESLHFVRPEQSWNRSLYYSVFLRTGHITNLPILVLATPHCTASSCGLDEEHSGEVWVSRLQKIRFLRHLDRIVGLPSSDNVLCAPDEYMQRLAEAMSCYSPCILIADPVYLGSFARYLKRNGSPVPEIRHLVSTFELLTGSLKDLLSEVFGCEAYTQYGASEIMDIANECERHKLHVRTNTVLVEAVRDGQPVGPGEMGKAVVTDLCNYSMPFIRYDIGDVVTLGDGECACGRNSQTIESIEGRVVDTIQADGPDGPRLLTPLRVDQVFRGLPGVVGYRLVQRAKDAYHISIMPDEAAADVDRQTLMSRCRSMFGARSQVSIEFVREIKPERSMKFRFVYSDVSTVDL